MLFDFSVRISLQRKNFSFQANTLQIQVLFLFLFYFLVSVKKRRTYREKKKERGSRKEKKILRPLRHFNRSLAVYPRSHFRFTTRSNICFTNSQQFPSKNRHVLFLLRHRVFSSFTTRLWTMFPVKTAEDKGKMTSTLRYRNSNNP